MKLKKINELCQIIYIYTIFHVYKNDRRTSYDTCNYNLNLMIRGRFLQKYSIQQI